MVLNLLNNNTNIFKNYKFKLIKLNFCSSDCFLFFRIIQFDSLNFNLIKFFFSILGLKLYYLERRYFVVFFNFMNNSRFMDCNYISFFEVSSLNNFLEKRNIDGIFNFDNILFCYLKVPTHKQLISLNASGFIFKYGANLMSIHKYFLKLLINPYLIYIFILKKKI